METTAKSKQRFSRDLDDLYQRGRRLIVESLECGVTAMRAHVEVDDVVEFSCLKAGIALKHEFADKCDVQIAVFAQERLYRESEGATSRRNLELLKEAASYGGVSVIGSAPYVESSEELAKLNVVSALDIAFAHGLMTDFHLDYNLSPDSEPLVFFVLDEFERRLPTWKSELSQKPLLTIGHATRFQLFDPDTWERLRRRIDALPVSLVSLPQSDVFMQGRDSLPWPPRGTLNVPQLHRDYGLSVAMSVNNVLNAFTPQGSLDPLSLCSFGVAIFQTAALEDVKVLLESVTTKARQAVGYPSSSHLSPEVGDVADFVILHDIKNLQSACFSPSYDRTTIRSGVPICRRLTIREHSV